MSSPELSLVIPAFNEAQRLPESLRRLAEFGAGLTVSWEVIVAVEQSTDGTLELAQASAATQPHFRVLDLGVHRGKGFAVREGMRQARGSVIFFMDADLSVPLEAVTFFLDELAAHPAVEIAVGNRKHAQSQILVRQSWLRERMGETFNWILQRLAGIEIRDTQCGFKAFRRNAAEQIFRHQKLDGFAFDVEILLLARKLGLATVTLPVQWINSPQSKVRIVRDSLKMLWDVVRVKALVRRTLRENRRD